MLLIACTRPCGLNVEVTADILLRGTSFIGRQLELIIVTNTRTSSIIQQTSTMKLTDLLSTGRGCHTFEFFPPRTSQGLANLLDRVQRMTSPPLAAPIAISVTWGAGGSTATRSLELAQEIVTLMNGRNVEVILHLTCTNMGRRLVDEALKKCRELGIQNILALRGDPPRQEEYRPAPGPDKEFQAVGDLDDALADEDDEETPFVYAEDLVRYIHCEHSDWFCVGVAGYPTPHPDSTSADSDIQFLAQKVDAGADFIITQLFYDVEGFEAWVRRVRAAGVTIPILPGIMPIQNYASFRRLTNLCKCPVPTQIIEDLEPIRSDDAAVKAYGATLATQMVTKIMADARKDPQLNVPGVHFCTLNLEKSVRTVLENIGWTVGTHKSSTNRVIESDAEVAHGPAPGLSQLSISPSEASHLAEDGLKRHRSRDAPPSSPPAENSWDEFPNGRFTDVRSPAYGEIDGWGNGLKITPQQALKEWGTPVDAASLSSLFVRYLQSDPSAPTTPFCDLPISPESQSILPHLIALNSAERQYWTVGSQPAVDGARSEDPIHGFGPKGGYVFQKSFVEFFVKDEAEARRIYDEVAKQDGQVTMYAGDRKGGFITNVTEDSVNAVTWAVFPGQEIVQSTIIEQVSFLAWKEEAFEIWTEWARLFPMHSVSRKLIDGIADNAWLISLIHHDYKDPEALWRFLRA